MENASKALIMAAGLLAGILMISLGVYIFQKFSTFEKRAYVDQKVQEEVARFNDPFLLKGNDKESYDKYNDTTTVTDFGDLITALNWAASVNIDGDTMENIVDVTVIDGRKVYTLKDLYNNDGSFKEPLKQMIVRNTIEVNQDKQNNKDLQHWTVSVPKVQSYEAKGADGRISKVVYKIDTVEMKRDK